MRYKEEIEKLGNTIIYLAERIPDLSKTKLLKIIYLIDELSIKNTGVPILNLNYEVWKLGPVCQDVYIDIDSGDCEDNLSILGKYINIETLKDGKKYIHPKAEFNDDEFTNNELYFLEKITNAVKHKTANDLIKITHSKGSLWSNLVKENDLEDRFNLGITNSSNILIDFEKLFSKEDSKKEIYIEYKAVKNSLNLFK